jgi:bifunctional DNase/RNase
VRHLHRDDHLHKVSSRPSDAVAIALRTISPIYVDDAVMEEAGLVLGTKGSTGTPASRSPGSTRGLRQLQAVLAAEGQ